MNSWDIRERILRDAYNLWHKRGGFNSFFDIGYAEGISRDMGISAKDIRREIDYLARWNLLEKVTLGGSFRITPLGITVQEFGGVKKFFEGMYNEQVKNIASINAPLQAEQLVIAPGATGDISQVKVDASAVYQELLELVDRADIPAEQKSKIRKFLEGAGVKFVEQVLIPLTSSVVKHLFGL